MLSCPADQTSKVRPAKMKRGVHHDLESFILVLFYSVMKRGLKSGAWDQNSDIESIRTLYHTAFGGHTIHEIVTGRSILVNPRPDCLLDAPDKPVLQLLYTCGYLLERQYANVNRQDLDHTADQLELSTRRVITHGDLYEAYDLAIRRISRAQ